VGLLRSAVRTTAGKIHFGRSSVMATINWAEWIQAIAALISAGVAIVLIKQLSLAKNQLALTQEQLELGVHWNKLSATFTFFSVRTFTEHERAAAESLSKLDVDLYHQKGALPPEIVKAVHYDANHFREIKSFLNFMEDYAAAVHTGVMDSNVSYQLMSDLVTRYYNIFKPLMEARRDEISNRRLWIEFETLALRWEPKRIAEQQKLTEQLAKAQEVNAIEVRQAEERANDAIFKVLDEAGTPRDIYPPKERSRI
jgi:Domain of unknown function (DUF4760)